MHSLIDRSSSEQKSIPYYLVVTVCYYERCLLVISLQTILSLSAQLDGTTTWKYCIIALLHCTTMHYFQKYFDLASSQRHVVFFLFIVGCNKMSLQWTAFSIMALT